MKLVLAADSAGKPLLDVIEAHLARRADLDIVNASLPPEGSEAYAEMTARAARMILDGVAERGIFCCGTGIGVSIAANKVPGIRAALTHDTYSAERAAKSNNAQVITLGARVIGPEAAKAVVDKYLESAFDPNGASAANVAAIDRLDAPSNSRSAHRA
jgi:ribose 5-phosphate isomerase B